MGFCQAFFLFFPEKSENIPQIGAKASFFMPKIPAKTVLPASLGKIHQSPEGLSRSKGHSVACRSPSPPAIPTFPAKERKELLKPATPSGTFVF